MWESLGLRKFPRLNINCDIDIKDIKSSFHLSTTTQNIGAGGVCVILMRELPRFSKINLRIHLNDSMPPIQCVGKVCWNVHSKVLFKNNETRFDTGIEFQELLPADRERIKAYIDKSWENVGTNR